jgi:hypothetical protein
MSRPNDEIEDRLRQALAARGEQVTPASLRPADPPPVKRPKRIVWRVPILAAAAVLAVLGVISFVAMDEQATTPPASPTVVHTSGTCDREEALITRALDSKARDAGGPRSADVDGDGRADRIATATDSKGGPKCRAFVGVRMADGATYSTVLAVPAVPPLGMPVGVIGVPDFGMDGRADIVVDTHFMADSALAQIFTWTEDGLVRVPVPATDDGNVTVDGGGVTSPLTGGCTEDGALVTSAVDWIEPGKSLEVTRQIYPVVGDDPLTFGSPRSTTEQLPVNRWPESARTTTFATCTQ